MGKLESTLDYTPVFIDGLVIAGAVQPALAGKIKDDFTSGRASVTAAKLALSQISNKDPQKKLKTAEVYIGLGNTWRQIVGRNHFAAANNEKISEAVNLITSIIDILVAQNDVQPEGVRGAPVPSEQELNNKIDQLDKVLKDK